MESNCNEYRDRLLDGEDPAAHAVDHLNACAACREWHARAVRLREALAALPRRKAPLELDGLVVASMQAGHREVRAARSVADLEEKRAPDLLARALREGGPRGLPRALAPAVLERLVAEEVASPVHALARRHVGGLPRLAAPAALDARVSAELARPASREPRGSAGRRRIALAAAAVFLAFLGVARLVRPAATTAPEEEARRSLSFTLVRSGPGELSPMARALVPRVLVDARESEEGGL